MARATDREFPSMPFFTLTDLLEKLQIEQRKAVKEKTVGRGAPHVVMGREILFATSSFEAWLKENEIVLPPRLS